MFDFVQKHKRIAQVVLALMTVPFAVWGIESYTRSQRGADAVATVNGLTITQREYTEELGRQQEQLRRMFGRNFDPAAFDTPQARQAMLDSLISQRLVASAAQAGHLSVSDEALFEIIESVPAFQSEGKFSKTQYELALRSANPPRSRAQFEAQLRYDLAIQQLARAVGDSAIAPRTVAERLAAPPGSRDYGRLSVALQWRADVKRLFDLPPRAFTPPPKVTSSVVEIRPLAQPRYPADAEILERVTAAAFNQRRKMLRQSLRSVAPDATALLAAAEIDGTARAEDLSVEQFCALARALAAGRGRTG